MSKYISKQKYLFSQAGEDFILPLGGEGIEVPRWVEQEFLFKAALKAKVIIKLADAEEAKEPEEPKAKEPEQPKEPEPKEPEAPAEEKEPEAEAKEPGKKEQEAKNKMAELKAKLKKAN